MHGFSVDATSRWCSPDVPGLGRIAMHSQLVAFADRDAARSGDSDASPWRRSLNGRWWFTLVDGPEGAPARFAEGDLDPSSGDWAPTVVPGRWETAQMDRPTGLYRAAVSIPSDWVDRRVVLYVGGADDVLYAYVNGVAVGMGTDSHLPNEFDVTHLIREGANTIALMVVGGRDGGGVTGDVMCYSTGRVHLADVDVRAGLVDPTAGSPTTGRLDLVVSVGAPGDDEVDAGWRVEVEVETLDGVPILDSPLVGVAAPFVRLGTRVSNIEAWSAEVPVRYRVVVSLIDSDDETIEVVSQLVGFRTVGVDAGQLLINGEPVALHGVVCDGWPIESNYVERVRGELEAMKRFNVDAVRFFGHPADSRVLDLCDELGFYVFEDANLRLQNHLPMAAVVERGARMVQRDRNHPSIVGWFQGVGVDEGASPAERANLSAMAGWIRGADPTRLIAREGDPAADPLPIVDLLCPVDPSVDELLVKLRNCAGGDRPVLLGRYSNSVGNATSGLTGWFSAFGANHELVGGFLCRWNDLVVAGDLDGTPKSLPGLSEFKYLASPVDVTASDHDLRRRKVRITNRQAFRGLSWLGATWELALDGVALGAGQVDLPDVVPGETTVVELPFERPETIPADSLLTITLRFHNVEPQAWADAGHEVAWRQFVVPMPAKALSSRPPLGPERRIETDRDQLAGRARIAVGKMVAEIDEAAGGIIAIRWAGQDLLVDPPRVDLWRAPTDQDRSRPVGGGPAPAEKWARWGLEKLHRAPVSANTNVEHNGAVSVVSRHKIWGSDSGLVMTYRQKVTVVDSGDILFDHEIGIPDEVDDLARVGMTFGVATELEKLQWVGPGPGETYPDRRAGAALGRWHSTATDSLVPYPRPQEHGLHVGTRWFALTRLGDTSGRYGTTGAGLFIGALDPSPFMFSVGRFTSTDLAGAQSPAELSARSEIVVHVDAVHRGLGEAFVNVGVWKWSWRMRPFDPLVEDPSDIATQALR